MKYRKPEEIIALLREAEASGERVTDFCRGKGIVEQTLYRWRRKYGQLDQDEAKRLRGLEAENARLPVPAPQVQTRSCWRKRRWPTKPSRSCWQKMVTPLQRREALAHLQAKGLSGRAARRWTGLWRSVLRYQARQAELDQARLAQMRQASQQQPRFGYRRVGVLAGLSFKTAWRLWQMDHFQLEKPQPRLRRAPGSDVQPCRAERPNHVWTCDLLHDQLGDGRRFKTLGVLDEFTRECLTIHVAQSIRVKRVNQVLDLLMHRRGAPAYLRSDNGSEFTATAVRRWPRDHQVGPAFIASGRPWQNGFIASFNDRLRDECLNREWFHSGTEAALVIERWRQQYNTARPHNSPGYRKPAQAAAPSCFQPRFSHITDCLLHCHSPPLGPQCAKSGLT